MAQVQNGSFRSFGFAGIDVYVHWSWLLVAYLELQFRQNNYTCGRQFDLTDCPECRSRHPLANWLRVASPGESTQDGPA